MVSEIKTTAEMKIRQQSQRWSFRFRFDSIRLVWFFVMMEIFKPISRFDLILFTFLLFCYALSLSVCRVVVVFDVVVVVITGSDCCLFVDTLVLLFNFKRQVEIFFVLFFELNDRCYMWITRWYSLISSVRNTFRHFEGEKTHTDVK